MCAIFTLKSIKILSVFQKNVKNCDQIIQYDFFSQKSRKLGKTIRKVVKEVCLYLCKVLQWQNFKLSSSFVTNLPLNVESWALKKAQTNKHVKLVKGPFINKVLSTEKVLETTY